MSIPDASVSLLDRWLLRDFKPGDGEPHDAHRPGTSLEGWISITAPGDVHRALMDSGRLPDPFVDRNERAAAWVETREWWYRHDFTLSSPAGAHERLRLVFHGLDTFATVYLDGRALGETRNMFRAHDFDVSDLQPGSHTLSVRFDPPLARVADRSPLAWPGRDAPRVAMRKAQFGYGWDWGPRLPTLGLWRGAELRRERAAHLEPVGFRTVDLTLDQGVAVVAVRVQVERFIPQGDLHALVRLVPPGGATPERPTLERSVALPGASPDVTLHLEITRPDLWWTHDLGTPALHDLSVTLFHTLPGEEARVIDRQARRVGVRTLVLDQSPDPHEPGTRFFRFVLNGHPVFARGANWIPSDSFLGAIAPDRQRQLLKQARGGNATMLRVWGGGVYESDAFYDACDELGLLVWQDFMFACAPYPEDEAFAAEVALEARYQVRRLRAHPCLALWCGNNENQWLFDMDSWASPGTQVPGARYYDEVLPSSVASEDGQTPYWPGSPYGGDDHNSMLEGDRHNWDVWHGNRPFDRRFGQRPDHDATPDGVDVRHYAQDQARFCSEFGLHAAPEPVTLRAVIPPDQWFIHSPALDHHNKDEPKNKGDNLLHNITGLPRDLDAYIAYSQIAQAEGLKFAVEHYRRRKPHCSGALVWQLNDCWPGLSWSYIDYHGRPKAAYFALRRAFAPVLVSFKPCDDGALELWVCNDTRHTWEDTLDVYTAPLDGRPRSGMHSEVLAVAVPAGLSVPVRRWAPLELSPAPSRYVQVHARSGLVASNRHFFAPLHEVPLLAAPRMRVEPLGKHRLIVHLESPAYVAGVSVNLPSLTAHASEGHLDLEPNGRATITLEDDVHPLDPGAITVRWYAPDLRASAEQ